ncbi:MAG: hypothetical protein ABW033_07965 [Acidimicrobiia bacterium]
MHRRAIFFLVAALVCALLVPATPSGIRWFSVMLAAVYLVLAAASWLDSWSRDRHGDT